MVKSLFNIPAFFLIQYQINWIDGIFWLFLCKLFAHGGKLCINTGRAFITSNDETSRHLRIHIIIRTKTLSSYSLDLQPNFVLRSFMSSLIGWQKYLQPLVDILIVFLDGSLDQLIILSHKLGDNILFPLNLLLLLHLLLLVVIKLSFLSNLTVWDVLLLDMKLSRKLVVIKHGFLNFHLSDVLIVKNVQTHI